MSITRKPGAIAGEELFVLNNLHGLEVVVSNFGACLRSVRFNGVELALGLAEGADPRINPSYLGVTVGRFANRIRNATFNLGGEQYKLTANQGPHQLHGGPDGFDKRMWQAGLWNGRLNGQELEGIILSLVSPHGDMGFPGELQVKLLVAVSDNNQIFLQYRGKTDRTTLCNPCNHGYWNLDGIDAGTTIDNHSLYINARAYFPVDSDGIPLGTFCNYSQGTETVTQAIDHCYLLDWAGSTIPFSLDDSATNLRLAARLRGTKAQMDVFTDLPGVQVYTGDFLDGPGVLGQLKPRQGIALETQVFPDCPNQFDTYREQGRAHGWPEMDLATWNAVLPPGIERRYTTIFSLGKP